MITDIVEIYRLMEIGTAISTTNFVNLNIHNDVKII
jgi:hypothetical protein